MTEDRAKFSSGAEKRLRQGEEGLESLLERLDPIGGSGRPGRRHTELNAAPPGTHHYLS